jgi:hypothetical protein
MVKTQSSGSGKSAAALERFCHVSFIALQCRQGTMQCHPSSACPVGSVSSTYEAGHPGVALDLLA